MPDQSWFGWSEILLIDENFVTARNIYDRHSTDHKFISTYTATVSKKMADNISVFTVPFSSKNIVWINLAKSCCTSSIFRVSKGVASHWSTSPCHSCRDSHKRHLNVKSFSTSVTSESKEAAWGPEWPALLSTAPLITDRVIEGTLITLFICCYFQLSC